MTDGTQSDSLEQPTKRSRLEVLLERRKAEAAEPSPSEQRSSTAKSKRRKFVEEFTRTGDNKESAIRAGFAPQRAQIKASELKREPDIEAALMEKFDEVFDDSPAPDGKTLVTEKTVIRGIQGIIKRARLRGEEALALKGFELLGKYLSMWKDRSQIEIGPPADLGDMLKTARDRAAKFASYEVVEPIAAPEKIDDNRSTKPAQLPAKAEVLNVRSDEPVIPVIKRDWRIEDQPGEYHDWVKNLTG